MKNSKQGFTLAEIMIVLTVIGIISAIIMPIAFKSAPDQNILKFKKANSNIINIINKLVNSKKFCNGDLGKSGDCETSLPYGTTYFCEQFADAMVTQSIKCKKPPNTSEEYWIYSDILLTGKQVLDVAKAIDPNNTHIGTDGRTKTEAMKQKFEVTKTSIEEAKDKFDKYCKIAANIIGPEITAIDGVVYYQAGLNQFGTTDAWPHEERNTFASDICLRYFSPPRQKPANYADLNGNDISYKIMCIDVDGIGKGEDPFGYGIRADGKVLLGLRAETWSNKSIQGSND